MTRAPTLRDQLHAAVRRIDALRARAVDAPSPLLNEALEELLTTFEELRATEEELRRQNDMLAAQQLLLEEGRARYESLFHFAPDPYLVTDLQGVVREANHAAATLLGRRQDRLAGKPLAVFVDPAQVRAFRSELAALSAGERRDDWELRLHPTDGAPVEVACTVAVVRGHDDRPAALRWLVRDVTGRRAAEERERRLEAERAARAQAEAGHARVRAILESITDAFFALDREGRLAYLNRRAGELLRRMASPGVEPIGRGLWELFTVADRGAFDTQLRRAADEGVPVSFEAFSPPLSTWFEVRAYPGPEGVAVYLADVTGRHRRAEADHMLTRAGELLARSLDPAETLQQVADVVAGTLADYCIVHVEKDGKIRAPGIAHADPTRRELLRGLLRRFPVEAEGPHPAVAALRTGEPQLLPRVSPELLEALATEPEHLEMLRALGLASAMAVPMRARGRQVGAISFGRTGGAPYDEADLEVARELARRAALAVDNALLHEEARAAVRAREEVLAVVSHDLRNPLNAVLIGATILDEFSEPDRWTERDRRQLHAIRNSAQQMATLIQDLVEVVALESGNRALSTERVDAGALLGGVAELFRELAAQKAIRLSAEAAAGLPPVRGDRARLLQVFSNLVGNALKFTPAGGAVTLGAAAPSPGAVVFRVSDSGAGIPAEQLPRVFDRFWQARRGEQAGMGLGLAIARGLVEAHGGRIWAESAPGAGSTFFFSVPAEEG